jgi:hypothetical protein
VVFGTQELLMRMAMLFGMSFQPYSYFFVSNKDKNLNNIPTSTSAWVKVGIAGSTGALYTPWNSRD